MPARRPAAGLRALLRLAVTPRAGIAIGRADRCRSAAIVSYVLQVLNEQAQAVAEGRQMAVCPLCGRIISDLSVISSHMPFWETAIDQIEGGQFDRAVSFRSLHICNSQDIP